MTIYEMLVIIILVIIAAECTARIVYYYRKPAFSPSQKIKMILFGRWLISEETNSPLYLKEIASSIGVDDCRMVRILAEASGKSEKDIRRLFLEKSGSLEHYALEPGLGFLPAPNQDNIHLKTNNLGFRGKTVLEKKPPHVKRVLLLGGSVAYGRTATSEQATISMQLQELLNKKSPDDDTKSWEVLNMAVPDFISIQECVLLLRNGMQFEPDIVISFSGINDPHHYLITGKLNEPASFSNIKKAYNAFFGKPFERVVLFLGSYLISVQFLSAVSRSVRQTNEEELSPFVYTIW